MKSLGLFLIAVGLVLPIVPAQAEGSTSFDLEAHFTDGAYYFTVAGKTERNPTLTVPANTVITINLKNTGDVPHNFCFVTDTACSEYVNADGDTTTFTFNSGASGGAYHCLPHKSSGMKGTVAIAGAAPPEEKASPGIEVFGIALAGLAAALLLRRK